MYGHLDAMFTVYLYSVLVFVGWRSPMRTRQSSAPKQNGVKQDSKQEHSTVPVKLEEDSTHDDEQKRAGKRRKSEGEILREADDDKPEHAVFVKGSSMSPGKRPRRVLKKVRSFAEEQANVERQRK